MGTGARDDGPGHAGSRHDGLRHDGSAPDASSRSSTYLPKICGNKTRPTKCTPCQTGPRRDQPAYDYLIQAMGGMMSIRLDKMTVKAGVVTFDVTNWSRSVLHEVLVVSVDNPTAPLPYDYPQARVPEDQVKVLGEAGAE